MPKDYLTLDPEQFMRELPDGACVLTDIGGVEKGSKAKYDFDAAKRFTSVPKNSMSDLGHAGFLMRVTPAWYKRSVAKPGAVMEVWPGRASIDIGLNEPGKPPQKLRIALFTLAVRIAGRGFVTFLDPRNAMDRAGLGALMQYDKLALCCFTPEQQPIALTDKPVKAKGDLLALFAELPNMPQWDDEAGQVAKFALMQNFESASDFIEAQEAQYRANRGGNADF